MQFRHTIILAITAIFATVSCISTDKSVGDNLIPDNQDLQVRTVELDIPVQTRMSEPLQTRSGSQHVFGSIRTPQYGLVQLSTVADICPNTSGWDFGKDPVVKECYFMTNISSFDVVDEQQSGIPQQITIHRTHKTLDSTLLFNNSFTEQDYDAEPLNLNEYIYFGGDSLKIYLKNSFAEEILASSQEERDSLQLFAQNYKGLLIKTSNPEDGINGGRLNEVAFGVPAIYIRVNFQPTWEEGLSRRDTIFTLSYGMDACLNVSSYQSSSLQSDAAGEVAYFEGAAGIKPYIGKDDIKAAIDKWTASEGIQDRNILIAKATLILPFEIPEDLDMTKYPSSIYPCRKELDTTYNQYCFNLLEDVNVDGYSIGAINRSLKEYAMDIPSYVQDLVSKDMSQLDDTYNLWMMPIYSETDSYYGYTYFYIDEATYYVGKVNGSAAERKPKLRIIYSVMD